MSPEQAVDPDLLSVLLDAEKAPRPSLFPGPQSFVLGLRDFDQLWKSPFKNPTRIQAHLLQVHRTELAHILRDMSFRAMAADPRSARDLYLTAHQQSAIAHTYSTDWILATRSILSRSASSFENTSAFQTINRSLHRPPSPQLLNHLALSSIRMAPSWQAYIYLAKGLVRSGDTHTAHAMISWMLHTYRSRDAQYFAHVHLGSLYMSLGRMPDALTHYRRAALIHPRPFACMNWFALSCLTDNKSEVLRSGRLLDSLDEVSQPPGPIPGDLTPRPNTTMKLLAQIRDKLESPSRRIADALTG